MFCRQGNVESFIIKKMIWLFLIIEKLYIPVSPTQDYLDERYLYYSFQITKTPFLNSFMSF